MSVRERNRNFTSEGGLNLVSVRERIEALK